MIAKATEHAETEHGLSTIPPDVAAMAKAAIKNKYADRQTPRRRAPSPAERPLPPGVC